MSAVATLRAWLYRLTASVPSAWHYDRLFRWMVIGAGVSLGVFVFRPHNPATSRPMSSATISSVPASLGSTYGAPAAGTPLAPPLHPALPNIAPGRSLDGVTITPAPVDSFGTAPPATRK
jgi:hypothetical protein